MSTDAKPATGGCLCGAVRYEVRGKLRQVIACHCGQCRRLTGHFMAATAARHSDFRLTEASGLAWYRSSDEAQRGFCSRCGATLFWEGEGRDYISIAAGTVDPPTHLRIVQHIFTADKSDYYEIADGAPQSPAGSNTGDPWA